MLGRRNSVVKAKPIRISVHPDRGYELTVRISEGPTIILDRVVKIPMSSAQLDAIADWDPKQPFEVLELESVES
jgi:hypothetical protein